MRRACLIGPTVSCHYRLPDPPLRIIPFCFVGLLLVGASLMRPVRAAAQVPDSAIAAPGAVDTVPERVDSLPELAKRGKPPVSPTGAMVRSILLPGWGQFALKRKTTGVLFVATEAIFVGLVVREQRRINDLSRQPEVADTALLGSARRKREDWIILGLVNHVAAGIEAYVSAYFWDFPDELQVRRLPGGGVSATVSLPILIR